MTESETFTQPLKPYFDEIVQCIWKIQADYSNVTCLWEAEEHDVEHDASDVEGYQGDEDLQ